MAKLLVSIGVLVVLAAGAWFALGPHPIDTNPTPVATSTATVGSGAGEQAEKTQVVAKLNERVSALGAAITVRSVEQDSRCALGVQCIWEGTVVVKTTLEGGMGTAEQTFTLNQPITTEAEIITLVAVTPSPVAGRDINDADYRFTFAIQKRQ